MNEELQNAVWAVLPAEFRNKIRNRYVIHLKEELNIRADELKRIFGEVNLTSYAEPEEVLCVNKTPTTVLEPKFHKGDKVNWKGLPDVYLVDYPYIVYRLSNTNGLTYTFVKESDLTPYTAPTDKAEGKELDLCELLKGHEGEAVFSPAYGSSTVDSVVTDSRVPRVVVEYPCGNVGFRADGTLITNHKLDGICQLFPSRALYEQCLLDAKRAWQIWADSQKPKRWMPSVGDRFYFVDAYCEVDNKQWNNPYKPDTWDCGNCFKTPEDAEYAAQEMRKCLERVHNELNNKNA